MPPSWTDTVDTLFTTTWSYRKKKATEQAFMKNPLLAWLRQRDRIENISGYRRIEIPLEYGANETVAWISKGDTVPIADSELVTMAYEDWKYVAVSVIRWMQDEQQNRGQAAMIKLTELKLSAAERALNDEFERVFWLDGSGSKEPNGIQALISTTPTLGTIHGMSRVTYDWFRNQQKTATGAFSVYGLSDMRTVFNNIAVYEKASLADLAMFTTQAVFEMYEDECMEIKQISNTMMADAGFTTLAFKGKPLMWAPSCPSGNMYFIHTDYLKLVCDESYWMDMTSWKEIPNQPNDRVAQIVCACNMTCSRPIVNAVLSGITA